MILISRKSVALGTPASLLIMLSAAPTLSVQRASQVRIGRPLCPVCPRPRQQFLLFPRRLCQHSRQPRQHPERCRRPRRHPERCPRPRRHPERCPRPRRQFALVGFPVLPKRENVMRLARVIRVLFAAQLAIIARRRNAVSIVYD